METTRHFTATVYVVNDGATALHEHDRLGMWLPPGGHLDRDELPHEAAIREVREELGLEVTLRRNVDDIESDQARSLPQPAHMLLEDINRHQGTVGHQHIDFVFYGRVDSRAIDPAPGEAPATAWEWVDSEELTAADRFAPDVVEPARRAIEAVSD